MAHAIFNRPSHVFGASEADMRTKPIYQCLPGVSGEMAMQAIRLALQGKPTSYLADWEYLGVNHHMDIVYMPYLENMAMVLIKNESQAGTDPVDYREGCEDLAQYFQKKLFLDQHDPHLVLWVNKDFLIFDMRYQPAILMQDPDEPYLGPIHVDDSLPADSARIEKQYIQVALESGERQQFKLELQKQCCQVKEECWAYPIRKQYVVITVHHISSVCRDKQHPSFDQNLESLGFPTG